MDRVLLLLTSMLALVASDDKIVFGGNLDAVAGYSPKGFAIWADLNATKTLALQPGSPAGTWSESWPIPSSSKHPFKHVFTQFNPVRLPLPQPSCCHRVSMSFCCNLTSVCQAGHPPLDGFGGGYGEEDLAMSSLSSIFQPP